MHILYVVDRFPVASETFVAEEIRGMMARRHEITIAALRAPSAADVERMGPALRAMVDQTAYLPRLPVGALLRDGWRLGVWKLNSRISRESSARARALPRLARAMAVAELARARGVDCLHAHWPRPTEVAILAARLSGRPFSISIHAHEVMHDAGHFPLAFASLRFATFCNRAAMHLLIGRLGQAVQAKSHLIYHGVDVGQFSATPVPEFEGELRVASAGRLTPTKGFDRLIRGIGLARTRGVNVTLAIFGEGNDRARLTDLIAELALNDAVTLHGWLPHEEMAGALGSHHLFALMADDGFHDGLPNVVLEAMSLGRPVILSPLPAAREAVRPGENGLILSAVDASDQIAEHFAALAAAPDSLITMGQRAAESVMAEHDRARLMDQLSSLFVESYDNL